MEQNSKMNELIKTEDSLSRELCKTLGQYENNLNDILGEIVETIVANEKDEESSEKDKRYVREHLLILQNALSFKIASVNGFKTLLNHR